MKIFLVSISILICQSIFAQAEYLSQAKIEFERKTNVWVDLKGSLAAQLKNSIPEYAISYFNFEFDGNQSIYQPGKASDSKTSPFSNSPASDNEVYTNYSTGQYIAHKNVFDKSFLIKDSLRKIKWKITGGFREIAGFNCRRATAIIMDSVFVVAFYTDEIMVTGGPESFNGLPGMILGLVINRLHTSWYATRVEVNSVNPKDITPPKKGKVINESELMETLKKSLSDWGDYANRNIWAIMI